MNIESFREYCVLKKGVTEEFPFGEDTLVFKVMGKIFALASLSANPFTANLKMNPDLATEYRERYDDVRPGFHMNKKMWNTVSMNNGMIPSKEIRWMIDHSYAEVVAGMTNKLKKELELL